MEEQVQIMQVNNPGRLSIFQQEKAAIDVQVATAKAYPRDIRRATDNAIGTVQMTEKIAGLCGYAIPRGKNNFITGPSVHLAKIVAQYWGNMRLGNRVIDIDLKHVTSQAICWDLETNLAIQTDVKRLIVGKEGRFSDDMITVTGNAANAISLRNAIFAVIPEQIIDRVYNASVEKLTGKLKDENILIAKRLEIFQRFKELYKATEEEVLNIVGRQTIQAVTKEDYLVLVKVGTALQSGDTTPDEIFKRNKVVDVTVGTAKIDRMLLLIKDSTTLEALTKLESDIKKLNHPSVFAAFDEKYALLANARGK